MPLHLESAQTYRRQRDNLIELLIELIRRVWQQMDPAAPVASYRHYSGTVTAQVIAGQLKAARIASQEAAAVLRDLNIDAPPVGELLPAGFVGLTSDGRPITGLLELPSRTVEFEQARGADPEAAMAAGLEQMKTIVSTELVDTNRAAMQAEITQRPVVTLFVRALTLPSCSRCTILAGRIYDWKADFLRHPNCDCTAIPANENVAGDLRTDPVAAIRAGQVRGLSRADTEAILEHGANHSYVVNVRRMAPLGWQYGSTVNKRVTARGTVKKTPAQILREARGDRAQAIEQLTRYGYIFSDEKKAKLAAAAARRMDRLTAPPVDLSALVQQSLPPRI